MADTPTGKRGQVRFIAPGVTIQGVIYPTQGAASYLLRTPLGVELELTMDDLSQAIGTLLKCSADTVRAIRVHPEYGVGMGQRVANPAHLGAETAQSHDQDQSHG